MSAPLLTTKLQIPPPPLLVECLNAGLPGRLTLVAAPAGFGKTTLVVDWLANVTWVYNNTKTIFAAAMFNSVCGGWGEDFVNLDVFGNHLYKRIP